MQSSNAPNKISLPFAASGTKNTIPVPSQQGITPGAASFTDGFPPLTFTPLSAGGVPPAGADFNGILNSITALQQWKSAGGQFPYDATFATAIGGYPKGATVLKADGTGLWISTAENNTTNPDTGGAGWLAFSASSVQSGSYNTAHDTGSANAYAMSLNPAPSALVGGMFVTLLSVSAANTGSATLDVNSLGALPINNINGTVLSGYELSVGGTYAFLLNNSKTAWILLNAMQVAASAVSIHAITEAVTYTNTTGGPIAVSYTPGPAPAAGGNASVKMDGTVILSYWDSGANTWTPGPRGTLYALIPSGHTYIVTSSFYNSSPGTANAIY